MSSPSGRPDKLPCTWVMFQEWRHLLFMSWPFSPDEMREHVPSNLELDTFDGKAWLSMLPMHMEDLHFRFLPPIPGTSDFPEINLRTYVRYRGQPAVYFFSLDASTRLGAFVARYFFHTPYVYAHMTLEEDGAQFRMESRRPKSRYGPAADFVARYRAIGDPVEPPANSLAHFLVERYSAIAETRPGRIYAGPVDHAPWRLTDAEAEVEVNTIPQAAGFELPDVQPELHFSWGTDTRLCLVERVRS